MTLDSIKNKLINELKRINNNDPFPNVHLKTSSYSSHELYLGIVLFSHPNQQFINTQKNQEETDITECKMNLDAVTNMYPKLKPIIQELHALENETNSIQPEVKGDSEKLYFSHHSILFNDFDIRNAFLSIYLNQLNITSPLDKNVKENPEMDFFILRYTPSTKKVSFLNDMLITKENTKLLNKKIKIAVKSIKPLLTSTNLKNCVYGEEKEWQDNTYYTVHNIPFEMFQANYDLQQSEIKITSQWYKKTYKNLVIYDNIDRPFANYLYNQDKFSLKELIKHKVKINYIKTDVTNHNQIPLNEFNRAQIDNYKFRFNYQTILHSNPDDNYIELLINHIGEYNNRILNNSQYIEFYKKHKNKILKQPLGAKQFKYIYRNKI